jgi:two-component system, OmpR family, response regulator
VAKRPAVALIGFTPGAPNDPAAHLDRRGFAVHAVRSAAEAEGLVRAAGLAVAVLGPGLRGADVSEFLRREASLPGAPFFLVVAPSPDLVAKVLALELGAADIVESASTAARELAARIARLVERRGGAARDLMVLENATVDLPAALAMHASGREEQLSPGQVALLRLFATHPSTVLSREDLIAAAPAEDADAFDRSIDSRVARLRRKLDTESITTVRGSGYRFDPP